MSYEVLARKWRPQQFENVVGQQHVTQTLKNAIKTSRIAHAYLLVGPRGTGKTSVARIFAKALNCVKGPTVTPCDKCDPCREIIVGTNLDVLEIDGASNNGVEQVRDLRETVKFAPTRGPFKIYIIDEVHMLSTPAFNALLKTLEEPPPHVKFIFATTEPEKILPTILSRCQRFDLRRIPVAQIVDRLRLIAKSEKIKVDGDALLAIARGSEGALRDAESALDQLVSFKGAEITENDVLSIFGLVARSTLEDLAEKILKGDIKSVIGIVAGLDEAGKDLQRLVVELMGHFRNLLVCVHVDDAAGGLDLMERQIEVLKKQAKLTNTARVLRITDILSDTENKMRYALSKRTLLETALIRCARASVVVSLEEILAQINHLRRNYGAQDELKEAGSEAKERVQPPPRKRYGEPRSSEACPTKPPGRSRVRVQTGEGREESRVSENVERRSEGEDRAERKKEGAEPEADAELAMLLERWDEIVERVGKIATLAKSSMMDARPVSVEGDQVVIGFDPEFASEAEKFESARNRKAVEHALSRMLKRNVTADFIVAAGDKTTSKVSPAEKKQRKRAMGETKQTAAFSSETSDSVKSAPKKRKSMQDWTKEPAVRKMLETFKGSIVDVRE